jgi:diacylglycerol kinase (ATP)
MRLMLLHNPSSGDEDHRRTELVALLTGAGHEVAYQSLKEPGWTDGLSVDADVIVVAGGDGSVRKVFTALGEGPTTTTIFPTGSANNIAHSLGFETDDPASLLAGWEPATRRRFDVWQVESDSIQRRFVESFGGGFFAEVLARPADESEGAEEKVRRGLELVRGSVSRAKPEAWSFQVDGERFRDEVIGLAAMNVHGFGPNLFLAPDADFGDGLLDLVLIRPGDAAPIVEYIDAKLEGNEGEPPPLETRRGRAVTMEPPGGASLHVDDELAFESRAPQELRLRRAPVHVEVLVPALP